MHPAGIKFGLSHGLLELNGADVVLSGAFLESISEMARRKVRRRKRVMGIRNDIPQGVRLWADWNTVSAEWWTRSQLL